MICTDCHKSYTGSGIRCSRCYAALQHSELNSNQKNQPLSLTEIKRCRLFIYLGAAFSFLSLIVLATLWTKINIYKMPCNTILLIAIRDNLNPVLLIFHSVFVVGLLFKSSIAAIFQFLLYCFEISSMHSLLGNQVLHPLPIIVGLVFLGIIYYCFKWRRLEHRFFTSS